MRIMKKNLWAFMLLGVFLAGSMVGRSLAFAGTAAEIDANVNVALADFYAQISGAKELADKAAGILVFPSVYKGGLILGGEYGEGALRVGGVTVEYYATAAVSFGLQAGVQAKSVILLFMTDSAVANFQAGYGWEVGVDGSVALIEVGAAGSIDTTKAQGPILGFVFANKGLMVNLSLAGTKFTKLKR